MPRTPCPPGPICLLLLLSACSAVASAAGHLHVALAAPQSAALPAPKQALAAASPLQSTPWVRIKVKSGDTLSGLFDRVGLAADQWHTLLNLDAPVKALTHLRPGDAFRLRKTPDGQLAELDYPLDAMHTLIVKRTVAGLTARISQKNATTQHIRVTGTIHQSLASALQNAGAPARIATKLAHIFAGREDLSRTLRAGDHFSVIYAVEFVNGDRVRVGPIIAASIHTQGQTLRAFRQTSPKTRQAQYYDSRGKPYQPSILRTPLHYTAISSPFDLHRLHPILGVVRKHTGVDLAAPRGTPVHAAADGTVTFVGRIQGYGRIVKIKHAMGYATRYAHLSRFTSGLAKGDHVAQGQTIAYVGESGLATGYHLHFEIRKNGKPHDPLTMKLPSGKPLTGAILTAFTNRIQPLITELADPATPTRTLIASNTGFGHYQACAESGTINSVLALAPGRIQPNALGQVFCAGPGSG